MGVTILRALTALQGNIKKISQMHGDFCNTNTSYSGCLHSHLMYNMCHSRKLELTYVISVEQ